MIKRRQRGQESPCKLDLKYCSFKTLSSNVVLFKYNSLLVNAKLFLKQALLQLLWIIFLNCRLYHSFLSLFILFPFCSFCNRGVFGFIFLKEILNVMNETHVITEPKMNCISIFYLINYSAYICLPIKKF